jgi:predicted alpha-1,2-mannosidase
MSIAISRLLFDQNKRYGLTYLLILSLTTVLSAQPLTDYVNPFIGTGGAGHTYPGATVPFGMVQVSPDTRNNDYKACAGYHYDDNTILGFSQTHLSGTGIGDMGDVLIQPVNYNPQAAIVADPTGYPYATRFSHDRESAEPGYYQVYLPEHKVNVELTATDRVALHRYAFEDRDTNALVIDLWHNLINWKAETTQWTNVQVLNDSTLIGYRLTHAWAHERYVYFAIRFSRPMQDWALIDMLQRKKIQRRETYTRSMRPIKVVAEFDPTETAPLLVKVGISGVSSAGALANLEEELPHWDFERVHTEAKEKWAEELGRIEIETDEKTKRVFYSALYHTFLAPVLYEDVDGQYRGLDHNFYTSEGTNYTVFSLWDTFRALHPLFTLIQQRRTGDMIRSMLAHYEQNTRKMLPVWSFHANETNCMVGYHAVPVIADAYLKGINNYDTLQMLDALVATANNPLYDGLDLYKEYGYIPIDLEKEAASKTLEYAFDDWSIARVADRMGQSDVAGLSTNGRSTIAIFLIRKPVLCAPNWQGVTSVSPSTPLAINSPAAISPRLIPGAIPGSCPTTCRG